MTCITDDAYINSNCSGILNKGQRQNFPSGGEAKYVGTEGVFIHDSGLW